MTSEHDKSAKLKDLYRRHIEREADRVIEETPDDYIDDNRLKKQQSILMEQVRQYERERAASESIQPKAETPQWTQGQEASIPWIKASQAGLEQLAKVLISPIQSNLAYRRREFSDDQSGDSKAKELDIDPKITWVPVGFDVVDAGYELTLKHRGTPPDQRPDISVEVNGEPVTPIKPTYYPQQGVLYVGFGGDDGLADGAVKLFVDPTTQALTVQLHTPSADE